MYMSIVSYMIILEFLIKVITSLTNQLCDILVLAIHLSAEFICINPITTAVSIVYQLLDIGLHNQLSNQQKSAYPSKHVCLHKMFLKEQYFSLEKSYTDA